MVALISVAITTAVAFGLWYAISHLWTFWNWQQTMIKISEKIPGLPRHWLLGHVHHVCSLYLLFVYPYGPAKSDCVCIYCGLGKTCNIILQTHRISADGRIRHLGSAKCCIHKTDIICTFWQKLLIPYYV